MSFELRQKALLKRICELTAAVNQLTQSDQDRKSSRETIVSDTRGVWDRKTTTLDFEPA